MIPPARPFSSLVPRAILLLSLLFWLPACPDAPDEDSAPSPTLEPLHAPRLVVEPESLDFGEVLLNTAAEKSLKLSNQGDAVLELFGINLQIDGGGVFAADQLESTLSLEPQQFITLEVTFQPTQVQAYGGSLRIESNDEDAALLAVPLTGLGWRGVDDDQDDVTVQEGDCDDGDPTVYPGADELCDGIDNDCDDDIDEDLDQDGDGFTPCAEPVGDCDDNNNAVYPGATEQCDGVDNNCDGSIDEGYQDANGTSSCVDDDHDGETEQEGDCQDQNPEIHSQVPEVCDGADNDCDGMVDEGFDADGDGTPDCQDDDQDGSTELEGDCHDDDATIYPGADETCDGIDQDCDGAVDDLEQDDVDGDGIGACEGDCNDASSGTYPGATEVCNGQDEDCDGTADEGVPTSTWYADADADGYGASAATLEQCNQPSGYVSDQTDCDDTNGSIHPNAAEVCNGLDEDCDGAADEGVATTSWYADTDGDGYGNAASSLDRCAAPAGYVADKTDCNDAQASIHPNATEVCNNIDDNCNGSTDEGVTSSFYPDGDLDGYGAGSPTAACTAPAGFSTVNTDCNDSVASIHPNAVEQCNSLDDDCDGQKDEGVTSVPWYLDADGDGYGTSGTVQSSCSQPVGYVSTAGDCNDSAASIHPNAAEQCNGVDENCNGTIDDGAPGTPWYQDADKDGYGNATVTTSACIQPAGYIKDATDCNDGVSSIHPGAAEACNGIDDDCDGTIDDGAPGTSWYQDGDGDTFGAAAVVKSSCGQPTGYVADNTDCDDARGTVYPGANELCNGRDDDCNGLIDDVDTDCKDSDDDGDGYTDNEGDCNDLDPTVVPITVDVTYTGTETGSFLQPFNSVQEGINATTATCPLVMVRPGTYNERLTFPAKALTVRSEQGAASTILNGQGGGSVVTFKNDGGLSSTLQGFTITGGAASLGAGIYISNASPSLIENTILGNTATSGGAGLYALNSKATLSRNAFQDNLGPKGAGGSAGGALYLDNGDLTITDNDFTGNQQRIGGAIGMVNGSDAILTGNHFEGNAALSTTTDKAVAGAIYISSASPTLNSNTFVGNTAGDEGGAVYIIGSTPSGTAPLLELNEFTENQAGNVASTTDTKGRGGAIMISAAAPVLEANTFTKNRSSYLGGALHVRNSAILTMLDNVLQENAATNTSAGTGGAIYLTGSSGSLETNLFKSNTAGVFAGALYLQKANNLIVMDNDIDSNVAGAQGGGLFLDGCVSTYVGENWIFGNKATSSDGGGLILADTVAEVVHNRLLANIAGGRGGGLWLINKTSTVTSPNLIRNNLIQGNRATGKGGGLFASDPQSGVPSRGQLYNNVFAENVSGVNGGALYLDTGAVIQLLNNVIIDYTAYSALFVMSPAAAELVITENDILDYDATSDTTPATALTGNLSVNTGFVAYLPDGVFNDDFHLSSGSALINAGNTASQFKDVDGTRNDIGLYGGPAGAWSY